ncbi:MAG TPA: LysR family transcriptional regulator [Terriglobales bacterium]|nr:LysR family transcriptional regulator [Terriglobales bacterium]
MFAIRMVNLSSIDLNLLVALEALISETHVGRAARKIGLSQPATSHALKRLRDLLSDPLLIRVGSKMELTPRAVGLREPLVETLQRVQTILVADSFEPQRSSRRFSVMMQDHIGHLVVPALVTRVHSDAPGVRFDVLPWQSPGSIKLERFRAIDLLLSCSINEIAGFQRETLFTETEVTVVRKGHPSSLQMKNLKAFLNSKHVAVVGRGLTEDPVDSWLREEGLTRQIVLRVPSYLQALQAVSQTDLVAFVPRRLAESLARSLSLALLRPPIDPGAYQEYLFYPRRAFQDPASIWLRKLALEIGKQLDPTHPAAS